MSQTRAQIKTNIDTNITTNGNKEITGAVLRSVLNNMTDNLATEYAGYQYAGVATPSTNPGTPDGKVFYIASIPDTYTNFGNLSVNDGEVATLKWNGTWTKLSIELSQAIRIAIAPGDVDINPEDPMSFETQFGVTPESILKHGLVYYDGDAYPVYFIALGCVGDDSDSYGTITFVGGLTGDNVWTIDLRKTQWGVFPVSCKTFKLTPDTTPTENSTNPVSSGGVYTALAGKQNTLSNGDGIVISDSTVASNTFGNGTATGAVRQINPDDEPGSTTATASGEEAIALGSGVASGYRSIAGGTDAVAEGDNSIAMGDGSQAHGNLSIAVGEGTLALNDAEVAIGQYNKSYDNAWSETAFTVGIGKSDENRINAFEVGKNGFTFIKGVGGYDGTNPDTSKSIQSLLKSVINPLTISTNVPDLGYDESDPQTISDQMGQSIEDVLTKGFVVYNDDVTTDHFIVVGNYGEEGGFITFTGINKVYQYDVDADGYITGEKVTSLAPDDELNDTSENAVQNKVVYNALASKQNTLTFDNVPTANSNNPVKSKGIKAAIVDAIADQTLYLDVDSIPSVSDVPLLEGAEVLGIGIPEFNALFHGHFLRVRYGNANYLTVNKITRAEDATGESVEVVLGMREVIINCRYAETEEESVVSITVNS